jgi:hypothetical protein
VHFAISTAKLTALTASVTAFAASFAR